MQTISVITHFDCTPTGTKSYRKLQNGYVDNSGRTISTLDDWNFSRNQQRNWETILQCVSLQTQPMNVSEPQMIIQEERKHIVDIQLFVLSTEEFLPMTMIQLGLY